MRNELIKICERAYVRATAVNKHMTMCKLACAYVHVLIKFRNDKVNLTHIYNLRINYRWKSTIKYCRLIVK